VEGHVNAAARERANHCGDLEERWSGPPRRRDGDGIMIDVCWNEEIPAQKTIEAIGRVVIARMQCYSSIDDTCRNNVMMHSINLPGFMFLTTRKNADI